MTLRTVGLIIIVNDTMRCSAFFNCYSKCFYAEGPNAECLYAEYRNAECRYAELHYVECHDDMGGESNP